MYLAVERSFAISENLLNTWIIADFDLMFNVGGEPLITHL